MVVVVAVVCVPPEAAPARALPLADSISATTGGVTAAKRPAFSRNSRRSASFVLRFDASSGMSVPPTPQPNPSYLAPGGLARLSLLTVAIGTAYLATWPRP